MSETPAPHTTVEGFHPLDTFPQGVNLFAQSCEFGEEFLRRVRLFTPHDQTQCKSWLLSASPVGSAESWLVCRSRRVVIVYAKGSRSHLGEGPFQSVFVPQVKPASRLSPSRCCEALTPR